MERRVNRIDPKNGVSQLRNRLVHEYYEKVNPNMTYTDFEKICLTPFEHLRKATGKDGAINEIKYNFLGKFIPKSNKLVWMLRHTKNQLDKGTINQATYNTTIVMITKYISQNAKVFVTFAEDLKPWIDITKLK